MRPSLRITKRAHAEDLLLGSEYLGKDAREIVQLLVDGEIARLGDSTPASDLRNEARTIVQRNFPVLVKFVEL